MEILKNKNFYIIVFLISLFILQCMINKTLAAPVPLPNKITIGVGNSENPADTVNALQIIFFLTILSLAPSLLIMTTAFTRIVIVLSFVRHSLSLQQIPPNQIVIGLALFLTFFVMAPTWGKINDQALQPFLKGMITQEKAWEISTKEASGFMLKHTRQKDLELFLQMSKSPRPKDKSDIPIHIIIPAFIISELNVAFQIGFLLFIPFLVIDMIVASILMSMGMMMLPPVLISLPFKILLFTLVDGWYLVIKSLVGGY